MTASDNRAHLLLQMYDQMWRNIDRHIIVVWQSVVVVISAVAAPILSKLQSSSMDLAVSVLILICGWGIAQALDGTYWYNRNLVIIANIEREFLTRQDLKDIHYYFGRHRGNKMIEHQMIQVVLSATIAVVFLLFHFKERILPDLSLHNRFDPYRAMPYILTVIVVSLLLLFKARTDQKYEQLRKNSPGKEITATTLEPQAKPA